MGLSWIPEYDKLSLNIASAEKHSTIPDGFPFHLFSVYVLFYAGQSIYNTYVNLFLHSVGISQSRIGLMVSVSTLFMIIAQLYWGLITDRARNRNRVVSLLLLASALTAVGFYLVHTYIALFLLFVVFAVFFNPVIPLLDTCSLELLGDGRRSYGEIRLGGTVGYCLTVLFIGWLIADSYYRIFALVSGFLGLCFLISLLLPRVEGSARKAMGAKQFRELFGNRQLIVMVLYNLVFSIGLNMFYLFYPIYFTTIGGDSAKVGLMMFCCALSEIPMLLVIRRLVDHFGIRWILLVAGCAATVRWLLLYLIKDPSLAILPNLLHGLGYTSFSYCIITYIGKSVPEGLRATGQSLNMIFGIVGSKVLFGFIGGVAGEHFGVNRIILFSALLIFAATCGFAVWSRSQKELLGPADPCFG